MKIIKECTAVILCGGKSSRMGFDKALLKLDEEYLIGKLVKKLTILFRDIILVTNHKEKFKGIEETAACKIVEDHYLECGPLGAISTAFEAVATPYLFVMACDIPTVNLQLIEKMYDRIEQQDILLLKANEKAEPLFAFYHKSCLPIFVQQLAEKNYKIRANFDLLDVEYYKPEDEETNFTLRNLNTIKDVEEWTQQSIREELKVPRMVLIGSSGRNSGKTTLAVNFIKKYPDIPIVGLKIVTILRKDGKCPRGGSGCGTCTNISGNFELIKEMDTVQEKDTAIMLEAGADEVYFLKVLKSHIVEGFEEFLKRIPQNALILCESNTLRKYVKPGIFIFLKNSNGAIKPTAKEVIDFADVTIEGESTEVLEHLQINKNLTISYQK
jgi:molybdopterin-guanine dinucleotide biosynthesis protein A